MTTYSQMYGDITPHAVAILMIVKITRYLDLCSLRFLQEKITLKTKSCHDANFLITDNIIYCQNDNLPWCQWWQSENIAVPYETETWLRKPTAMILGPTSNWHRTDATVSGRCLVKVDLKVSVFWEHLTTTRCLYVMDCLVVRICHKYVIKETM